MTIALAKMAECIRLAGCHLQILLNTFIILRNMPNRPLTLQCFSILNNEESHISMEVVDLCKVVGIILLTFPLHCSCNLQPLDLTVYVWTTEKLLVIKALTEWVVGNSLETIHQAYKQQNIQKGFEKDGIWPFNLNIFSGEYFLCSSVTDLCFVKNMPTNKATCSQVVSELPVRKDYREGDPDKLQNKVVPSSSRSFARDQVVKSLKL